MAKSNPSFNKREKEKRRLKKKKEKRERMEARKAEKAEKGGPSFDDMIAYIDENGNFTDTPPDPKKKKEINPEDIVIGVPSARQEPDDPIRKGWVKFFNESKGFGFLIGQFAPEVSFYFFKVFIFFHRIMNLLWSYR